MYLIGGGILDWIERIRMLLEAISKGEYCCLRHGLPYVTVGELVRQSLCEMRLHLEYTRGVDVEARRRELRLLVEAVLEARRRIPPGFSDGVISLPLAAVVEGVPITGRPDSIVVRSGRVEAIVWAKVGSLRLKMWDRIRLYTLGLLVDYAEVPTTHTLHLVLVAAREPGKLVEPLKTIRSELRPIAGEGYMVHVLVYDKDTALKYVGPLLAYWRGEREPVPRPSKACSSCPYRDTCPYSLNE